MTRDLLAASELEAIRTFSGYRDDANVRRLLAVDRLGRHRSVLLLDSTRANSKRFDDASKAASRLDENPRFARFISIGEGTYDGASVTAWIEDWIRGIRLIDLIEGRGRRLLLSDLQQLVLDLSACLSSLHILGLQHGNISLESILLTEPAEGSLDVRYSFKLANLSAARLDTKDHSDDRDALRVLAHVTNALLVSPEISGDILAFLRRFRDYLVDVWRGIDNGLELDPSRLHSWGERKTFGKERRPDDADPRLSSPFDFLSAEHFSSDRLLYQVFAKSCPWVEDVARPVPLLLEGPRGCGKSMVLRWLSLRTQLSSDNPVSSCNSQDSAGFYVACASEVQSRVAPFADEDRAKSKRRELLHYLNMVVLREVATTLVLMADVGESAWGFDDGASVAVFNFITSSMRDSTSPAAGADLWAQIRDLSLVYLDRAHSHLEDGPNSSILTNAAFLHDLARTLTDSIPFFATKRIAYCLDDYSAHRIPRAVQQVFNEAVFTVRTGNHVFKISSENRGFYPFRLDGVRIDAEREMTRIDFGSSYLTRSLSDNASTRAFARDLLANRLSAAGWAGTPETLLGADSISDAEFARLSRSKNRPEYAGLPTIAELCSGDVAHLLLIYRKIFELGRVDAKSERLVPTHVQDTAIRATSRELLGLLKSDIPYGDRSLELVETFCSLAQWALMEAPLTRERTESVPRRQTRIEIDGFAIPESPERDSVDEFFVDLIRRAVFVELKPGVSRRNANSMNLSPSVRLALRRVYLPAFGLSLGKNMSWNWSEGDFMRFLVEPSEFCQAQKEAISTRGQGRRELQPGLFEPGGADV